MNPNHKTSNSPLLPVNAKTLSIVRKFALSALMFVLGWMGTKAYCAQKAQALYPVRKDGLFGFIDRSGRIVIEPQFGRLQHAEKDTFFSEGLEPVIVDDLTGYIDQTGRIVIAPQFRSASEFSEGLAPAQSTVGKWGYINKKGTFVIAPIFEEAWAFSEGRAQVVASGLMGFIDAAGAYIIAPRYRARSHYSNFSEGLACVEINGKWGFIDSNGKVVIEPRFFGPSIFKDGFAPLIEEGIFGHCRYIDRKGSVIAGPFFKAWPFSSGFARVETDGGRMAFINRRGQIVFQVNTDAFWAGEFSEGLVKVQFSVGGQKKWGYLDTAGREAIPPLYDDAGSFSSGIAHVQLGFKQAYINTDGKYIWGPEIGNRALADRLMAQASAEERREMIDKLLKSAAKTNAKLATMPANMQRLYLYSGYIQDLAKIESLENTEILRVLLGYLADDSICLGMPEVAVEMETEVRTNAAKALIKQADPYVVPILVQWAAAPQISDYGPEQTVGSKLWSRQLTAFAGLSQFLYPDALPSAQAIVEEGLKPNDKNNWHIASDYAAQMAVHGNEKSLVRIMNDEAQYESTRYAAAASLVRLGEDDGRRFLLENYRRFLATINSPKREGGGYETLSFLGDAKIIAELSVQEEHEPPGTPRNNLNTLLPLMRISEKPVTGLKIIAEDENPNKLNERLHAIRLLGERCKKSDLPYLISMVDAGGHYRNPDWNKSVRELFQSAVLQVRHRTWAEDEPK